MLKKFFVAFGSTVAFAVLLGFVPPFEKTAEAGCTKICSSPSTCSTQNPVGEAFNCTVFQGECILFNFCTSDINLQ